MLKFLRKRMIIYYFSDDKSQKDPSNVALASYVSHEITKKGPPSNKNISVKNIKAQIANMSCNENTGFKSEYHVRTNCFSLFQVRLS